MNLRLVFTALLLCVALVAVPSGADATHGNHRRCGINTWGGSSIRTYAYDTNQPYCDVQARITRWVNGNHRHYYSGWRLYKAEVTSTAGHIAYTKRNCARYRYREHNGTITYVSPWFCK